MSVAVHYLLIKYESNNKKFHVLQKRVTVKLKALIYESSWSICSNWKDYILTIKNQIIVLSPDKYCHNPELQISLIQAPLKS